MRDQIEEKYVFAGFSQTDRHNEGKEPLALQDLPRGLVWEILTHQGDGSKLDFHQQEHPYTKDKPGELCAHQPQEETASQTANSIYK